ncbi:MAG: methyl-accepting chemotaxis protein [Clostridia bacterium]|nr:methyl-accepting chemotaxis protein [Clostridia bacterium]
MQKEPTKQKTKDKLKKPQNKLKSKKFWAELLDTTSIRMKLIICFLVLIIAPLVISSTINYSNTAKTIKESVSNYTIESMEMAEQYLGFIISNIDQESMKIFTDKTLQESLKILNSKETNDYDKMNARKNIEDELNNIVSNSKFIDSIYIVNDKNTTVGAPSMNLFNLDNFDEIVNSDWYKNAVEDDGKASWIGSNEDIFKSSGDRDVISQVRMLKSISFDKGSYGVLKINISVSNIYDLIKNFDIGNTGQISLATPDRKVISNVNGELKKDDDISSHEYFETIAKAKKDNGSFTFYKNDKEYMCTYFKFGQGNEWTLIGNVETDELLAPARDIRSKSITLIIICCLFGIVLAFFVSIAFTKDLITLSKIMAKAEKGDLNQSISRKRKDEVGKLANSFNNMLKSIRILIGDIANATTTVSQSASSLASTSQETAAISDQVSHAVQEIAKGASEQAMDAETGVKNMDTLAEKVNEITANAKTMSKVADDTKTLTKTGLDIIKILESKSDDTSKITKAITMDINELSRRSIEIDKIIGTINTISDQTNLLALNAAIEAAKAGESGRGFAVVASEIRKLAEQSQDSTKEIARIIKNIQQKTDDTVQTAESANEVVKAQIQAVSNATETLDKISEHMEDLVTRIEIIHSAIMSMENDKDQAVLSIQNISAVSQQTAASTQEVSASTQQQLAAIEELSNEAQKLNDAAESLKKSISKFKI